jgi:hypothetical protein
VVVHPIILATQKAEIRRIMVQSQPRQIVCRTLSRKTLHKKGLVEWLKVKALSSSPSTAKKEYLFIYLFFTLHGILPRTLCIMGKCSPTEG